MTRWIARVSWPVTGTRQRRLRDRLDAGYWFVPAAMGLLAFLLAQAILAADAAIPDEALARSPLVYGAGAADMRMAMLGLAGTVLGTAGVVYSLLTLPLSVAAAQFGSRLLRLYLRDRTIHAVLGLFGATFVYCLAVALAIPADGVRPDAPQLATTCGLLLGLATLASLVVLVHHVAVMLQAPNLIAAASAELRAVIRALPVPQGATSAAALPAGGGDRSVAAAATGYVQSIDAEALLALAVRHDLTIHALRRPGDFVRPGEPLAAARPDARAGAATREGIRGAYALGDMRTPTQDVEFAFALVVEVALRAMSAAINDPFTALTCLDHLGAALALYGPRATPAVTLADGAGRPRLRLDGIAYGALLDAVYNLLRRASRDTPDVLLRLADSLGVAGRGASDAQRAEVRRHLRLVAAECRASSAVPDDRERVERLCAELLTQLEGPAPVSPATAPETAGAPAGRR